MKSRLNTRNVYKLRINFKFNQFFDTPIDAVRYLYFCRQHNVPCHSYKWDEESGRYKAYNSRKLIDEAFDLIDSLNS